MDEMIFARILALQAEMEAIKAEIAGMEAENTHSIKNDDCVTYSEGFFQRKAEELRGIARELNSFGRG